MSLRRSVRFQASWTPEFMPKPPSGLLMWAASPISSTPSLAVCVRHALMHAVDRPVRCGDRDVRADKTAKYGSRLRICK